MLLYGAANHSFVRSLPPAGVPEAVPCRDVAENERAQEIMSLQVQHQPVRTAQQGARDLRELVCRNKAVGFNTYSAQYCGVRVNRAPTGLTIGAATSGDG